MAGLPVLKHERALASLGEGPRSRLPPPASLLPLLSLVLPRCGLSSSWPWDVCSSRGSQDGLPPSGSPAAPAVPLPGCLAKSHSCSQKVLRRRAHPPAPWPRIRGSIPFAHLWDQLSHRTLATQLGAKGLLSPRVAEDLQASAPSPSHALVIRGPGPPRSPRDPPQPHITPPARWELLVERTVANFLSNSGKQQGRNQCPQLPGVLM